MNKILLAALVPAIFMSACASADKANGGTSAQPGATGTQYCWKGRLSETGGQLVCNWESSAADACRSTHSTQVAKASVKAGPTDAGRCNNGEWLVQITAK